MPRLLLLLAAAVILYTLFKRIDSLPPAERKAATVKLLLGVLVVAVILLTVTGKMHWVGAALTAVLVGVRQTLPLLVRAFPVLQTLLRMHQAKQGTFNARIIRLQVDVSTGAIDGEIREGEFAGKKLSELTEEQLKNLLDYCRQQDPSSAQLLASYIQRSRGGDWASGQQYADTGTSSMDRVEALAILGLKDDASEKDIVTAHRKMMQKMHPDRGGSDYLAAKINQAKDQLIG